MTWLWHLKENIIDTENESDKDDKQVEDVKIVLHRKHLFKETRDIALVKDDIYKMYIDPV